MTAMLADLIAVLACPLCGGGLALADGTVRCPAGHAFDVARQGYVSLLPGNAHTGSADTADMVRAREEFLAAGHYRAVAAAVATRAAALVPPEQDAVVVDVGAGTGYYLHAVLARLPQAVGAALDLSKHAARRAARADPRIGAVVCDGWKALPVGTGVAALALSVFAPRNAPELWRVLQPGGAVLVVTPTDRHLAEIIAPLGLLTVAPDKDERLAAQLGGHFAVEDTERVEATLHLSPDDAGRVVLMGPNAWHTDADTLAGRLAALGPLDVTVSVTVAVYRRRDAPVGLAGSAR